VRQIKQVEKYSARARAWLAFANGVASLAPLRPRARVESVRGESLPAAASYRGGGLGEKSPESGAIGQMMTLAFKERY